MSWGKLGREIVKQMNKKDADYKALAESAIAKIYQIFPDDAQQRKNALTSINREILKKYPRSHQEKPDYYHDPKGKESLPKWRHNIFQWLTLEQKDWDKLHQDTESGQTSVISNHPEPGGDGGNADLSVSHAQRAIEGDTITKDNAAETVSTTNTETTLTLLKMIEQLNPEIKEMAQTTMAAQGIDWQELIEKSLNQYCKGYVNRTQAQIDEISEIKTEKLLNDPTLRTHPDRAKELTKRAIIAIKKHNDHQPENAMRWMISASIIGQLIKSKTTTVNQCLQDFKDDIESHNAKYEFGMMHNRGKGDIGDFVNLITLCPTGE